LVALLIGGIEALGLIAEKLRLEGGFWDFIGALNDNFGVIGYLIIGIFLIAWLVSAAVYRSIGTTTSRSGPARLAGRRGLANARPSD